MINVLELYTLSAEPEVAGLKEFMERELAGAEKVLMSGSGPTVFALFGEDSRAEAEAARESSAAPETRGATRESSESAASKGASGANEAASAFEEAEESVALETEVAAMSESSAVNSFRANVEPQRSQRPRRPRSATSNEKTAKQFGQRVSNKRGIIGAERGDGGETGK